LGGVSTYELAVAVIWIALFFLVSGPVHECMHAFTAWKMGDGTAKLFGRVTLDPVAHFDPVGGGLLLISVLLGLFAGSPIGFGWAKPTPVNPYNLRGRHADSWVSAAGPLSNLVLAIVFAIAFRIAWANGLHPSNDTIGDLVCLVFWIGIQLNIVLMLFNLIPIAPLDGSHVLLDMVSPRRAMEIRSFMNQYGLLLLVVVIMFAGQVISPILRPILSFLAGVPVG
jgi:Zn-dependent protease